MRNSTSTGARPTARVCATGSSFFVDNRNVIGKDVPFQLLYQRSFHQPLFTKNVVLAHDVDDFSKIWQAMGRSRTMNATQFAIYKSGVTEDGKGARDIKAHALTRQLYVHNCDCKMAGNLSSIYQTLISLLNLAQEKFYYCDDIVNTFLEKMENTIAGKVGRHEELLNRRIFGASMPSKILTHILADKFRKSSNTTVRAAEATPAVVQALLHEIVQQKDEQRAASGDIYDAFICFLSGEQQSLMEISYTKQQQKQKQKQRNRNQDSDTMDVFNRRNQLEVSFTTDDYFEYTLKQRTDLAKISLNLPVSVPIFTLTYALGSEQRVINVYPTLQFLYSHHVQPEYITETVRGLVNQDFDDAGSFCARFLAAAKQANEAAGQARPGAPVQQLEQLEMKVLANSIRQNPQYTLAALEKGIYLIGMKDQFNKHDLQVHPLRDHVQYIADDAGFILFDRKDLAPAGAGAAASVDSFGPYFIEQYILMEVLSKQEVAQNVLEYYCRQKDILERALSNYSESQGKGFICWRFLMNEAARMAADPDPGDTQPDMEALD